MRSAACKHGRFGKRQRLERADSRGAMGILMAAAACIGSCRSGAPVHGMLPAGHQSQRWWR